MFRLFARCGQQNVWRGFARNIVKNMFARKKEEIFVDRLLRNAESSGDYRFVDYFVVGKNAGRRAQQGLQNAIGVGGKFEIVEFVAL